MLAQVDAAHAAGAEPFQHLVLADVEPPPLALEDLFGLEVGQDAVAHRLRGQLLGVGRQGVVGAQLVRVSGQAFFLDQAALLHQVQEFSAACR